MIGIALAPVQSNIAPWLHENLGWIPIFGLATAGAQPQWPGQTADGAFMLAWLLFAEGSFQFLDGGRLDFGVVRDSVLDATNDYETFVELFEGVAFRGLECFQVQSMILPTGASAAGSTGTYHE